MSSLYTAWAPPLFWGPWTPVTPITTESGGVLTFSFDNLSQAPSSFLAQVNYWNGTQFVTQTFPVVDGTQFSITVGGGYSQPRISLESNTQGQVVNIKVDDPVSPLNPGSGSPAYVPQTELNPSGTYAPNPDSIDFGSNAQPVPYVQETQNDLQQLSTLPAAPDQQAESFDAPEWNTDAQQIPYLQDTSNVQQLLSGDTSPAGSAAQAEVDSTDIWTNGTASVPYQDAPFSAGSPADLDAAASTASDVSGTVDAASGIANVGASLVSNIAMAGLNFGIDYALNQISPTLGRDYSIASPIVGYAYAADAPLAAAPQAGLDAGAAAASDVPTTFADIGSQFADVGSDITGAVANLTADVGSDIAGIAAGVADAAADVVGAVAAVATDIVSDIFEFIADIFSFFPVVLDVSKLVGMTDTGISITQLSSSNTFFDTTGDGQQNLTAWAGAGNGVLFFDPTGQGQLTQLNQIDFTDWDPGATSDLQALEDVFDTNHDGSLDAGDADFNDFFVMVTNANGTQTVYSLAQLGITSINLTANATNISLPDGSSIQGETTYTTSGGVTGTAAAVSLASDSTGYAVTTTTTNADGSTTPPHKGEGNVIPTPRRPARRSCAASPIARPRRARCLPRSRRSRIAATGRADRGAHIWSPPRCAA